jgi:hypothetical protein
LPFFELLFASKVPFSKKLLIFAFFASVPLASLLSAVFHLFFLPLFTSAFQQVGVGVFGSGVLFSIWLFSCVFCFGGLVGCLEWFLQLF